MKRSILILCLILSAFLAGPGRAVGQGDIRPFGLGSFSAILKAGEGRARVVAFWSLTCPPCLAEMPMWAKLVKERPDVGFSMISTDKEEDLPRIRRVLAKYGLGAIDAWFFAERFVERLRFDVDKKWRGEVPKTYLIDPQGRIETVTGFLEEADLKDWLERGRR